MVIDPRAPVIVGVGQTNQRVPADEARPPIELLADAARLAADDTASPAILERVDTIAVVAIGSWQYANPGAFLARLLRIEPRATAVSTVGGNSPQLLIDDFATRIQHGELDVVLIGGAESMHTRWRARKEPRVELTWDNGDDAPCDWVIGDNRPGASPIEMAHLAVAPTMVYPLFETALRAELDHSVDEHQKHVSELWSRFAQVASENPHAWSRTAYSPADIRSVSPDNRMVCFPYPKRMCSNIDVDQAAAVILCSYEAARAAGIADDRMVFIHSAAEAHDHWFVTERWSLADSPAIAATTRAALHHAGTTIDGVAHIDLYSCFPAAVQVAQRALGLRADDSRPGTVTGGLGFAGGPVNNYPTHAIATMVERLRAEPEAVGLTTALGWYLSKHAAAVWSARPPAQPFACAHVQDEVDALPRREPAGLVDTSGILEASSVSYERDGTPSLAIVTTILDDGTRAIANSRAADVLQALVERGLAGERVKITNDGTTNTLQ
jgi:acetyl-CoA C-acetyltransferase